MNTLNALLRSIITQPDEDVPRLLYAEALDELDPVYADCPSCVEILTPGRGGCWPCFTCGANGWSERTKYLDRTNSNRAAFIRAQIALARAPQCSQPLYEEIYSKMYGGRTPVDRIYRGPCGTCDTCEERTELTGRAQKLLTHLGRSFISDFTTNILGRPVRAGHDEIWFDGGTFRTERGFVSMIECSSKWFLQHGDMLIWHDEQTVKCSNCKGHVRIGLGCCQLCANGPHGTSTGRVPRECPDTAQPIRTVVMSDRPNLEYKTLGSLDGSEFPVVAGQMINVPYGSSLEQIFQIRFGRHIAFKFPEPALEDPDPEWELLNAPEDG